MISLNIIKKRPGAPSTQKRLVGTKSSCGVQDIAPFGMTLGKVYSVTESGGYFNDNRIFDNSGYIVWEAV